MKSLEQYYYFDFDFDCGVKRKRRKKNKGRVGAQARGFISFRAILHTRVMKRDKVGVGTY